MRRALLTAAQALAPFTVGDPNLTSGNLTGGRTVYWTLTNPAPRAGVITSISMYAPDADTVRVLTGTGTSTSFTVADTTGDLTTVTGVNTFTVGLAIPAGGVLAFWSAGGSGAGALHPGGGGSYMKGSTTAPTVGSVYTGANSNSNTLSLNGTGS